MSVEFKNIFRTCLLWFTATFCLAGHANDIFMDGLVVESRGSSLRVVANDISRELLMSKLGETMGFDVVLLANPAQPLGKINGEWQGPADRTLKQIFRGYNLAIQLSGNATEPEQELQSGAHDIQRVIVFGRSTDSEPTSADAPTQQRPMMRQGSPIARQVSPRQIEKLAPSPVTELLHSRASSIHTAKRTHTELKADFRPAASNSSGQISTENTGSTLHPGVETSNTQTVQHQLKLTTAKASQNLDQLMHALHKAEAALQADQ